MSEHSVKIFLILLICSGVMSLMVSAYLRISEVKRSPNPARVRLLARKYFLRGSVTELLSLLAYFLVLREWLAPSAILLGLAAILLGIEFLIVRLLKLNAAVDG